MENSRYVFKNGKRLRTGYTTGSCAAAAAKAAVSMLFNQNKLEHIEIDTPKGWKLKLQVFIKKLQEDESICYVIKDAGDDPDITDGVEVYAKARKLRNAEIMIKAGEGIGNVTRKGLSVEEGNPAINPVPMKMIREEVDKVLPKGWGVEIEISIPKGKELAKRTFNPKLGILGGLSILGTSGIVEPMSEEALKDTIAIELRHYKAQGKEAVILVPGNYGEEFCKRSFGIAEDKMIKMSNYIGFALEKCAELHFKKVVVAGHIGKLIKTAAGIFNTHSRVSDTRMEILTAYLGIMGMNQEGLIHVMNCRTTEEVLPFIDEKGYKEVYQFIADQCKSRCQGYVFDALEVGVVLFSMKSALAMSENAQSLLEEIRYA